MNVQAQQEQEDLDVTQQMDAEEIAEAEAFEAAAEGKEVRVDDTPADEPQQQDEQPEEQPDQSDDQQGDDPAGQQIDEPAEQPADQEGGEGEKAQELKLKTDELMSMLAKIPQLEEMSTKEIQKVHGKIGELNRTLQELKSKGAGSTAVRLAEAKFDKLREEYPDLAELLAEDFKGLQLEGPAAVSDEVINAHVEARVQEQVSVVRDELQKQMQVSLLQIQHPDFQVIKDSDEFKVFLQTLPEEERQKVDETWDAMYLSTVFTNFKSWKNERTKSKEQRQSRLRNALPPKTNTAPVRSGPMTEEEAFALAAEGKL